MINKIMKDAEARMHKSIDALKHEFVKLRTGRATPSLLEHILVDYYGTPTPLHQVASVNVQDARTLSISPWEKNLVPVIEKAILTSDLGLNPATSGTIIRVPMPALTAERRKELTKIVRNAAEDAKIALRNIRRDANSEVKELLKTKQITEDDEHRGEDSIQKLTDRFVAEADKLTATKEAELMEI